MLYRLGARTPVAQLLDLQVAGVYALGAVIMLALTLVLLRARLGWNNAAFAALVAAFPNTGFMGVPMLAALLGEHSAGVVIVSMAVDMVFTSSLCIALSRLEAAGGHGAMVALRQALKSMAANPMPWAIVLGGLASVGGWSLPGPMEETVAMLAAAASPVALFSIGAVLARSQMESAERLPVRDYLPVVGFKLLLHPLLLWCLARLAQALGVELEPQTVLVLVLLAALPSASNVVLLTERFGAHSGLIARIILVSTVLAFVSFPVIVANSV